MTVVYRPRETMRRVLDGHDRWTIQIVVLATVCAAVGDPDIRHAQYVVNLSLATKLALVVLALVVNAACWIGILYLFAWAATVVGRRLDGHADVADVRAAVAWGVVPVIWSVVVRIQLLIYAQRLVPETRNTTHLIMDFIANGGCTFAILVLTFQLLLYVWIAYVASSTVGEALRFSSWKGLATISIVFAVPFIIGVAASLASRT